MPPRKPVPDPDFTAAPPANLSALESKFNIFNDAAKKDLHWWFFALLMIGMAAFAFLYQDMRREREALSAQLNEVRKSQLEYVTAKSEAMMGALLNNTRALEANTQTLNRIENRKGNE